MPLRPGKDPQRYVTRRERNPFITPILRARTLWPGSRAADALLQNLRCIAVEPDEFSDNGRPYHLTMPAETASEQFGFLSFKAACGPPMDNENRIVAGSMDRKMLPSLVFHQAASHWSARAEWR